jgi:ribonuclease HI
MEVYDAELYALRAGLREGFKYITYNPIIDNIYLFSDNQAAIKRLKSLKTGPGQEIALDIWELAEELYSRNINISIEWVPGHTEVLV